MLDKDYMYSIAKIPKMLSWERVIGGIVGISNLKMVDRIRNIMFVSHFPFISFYFHEFVYIFTWSVITFRWHNKLNWRRFLLNLKTKSEKCHQVKQKLSHTYIHFKCLLRALFFMSVQYFHLIIAATISRNFYQMHFHFLFLCRLSNGLTITSRFFLFSPFFHFIDCLLFTMRWMTRLKFQILTTEKSIGGSNR